MSDQTENPTFQIPRDVIEPIIKAHVATAVSSALGGRGQLIEEAIRQVLFAKVNPENGKREYSYGKEVEFIQWLANDCLKRTIEEIMKEEMGKYKEQIKRHIIDSLSKKNSPVLKQLAEGMAGVITNADTLKWRLQVSYQQ